MQSVSQSVSQCVIEDRWKRRRKKKAEAHVRSVSDYSPFLPSPLLRSSLRPSLAVVASRASCPICGAAAAAVVYSLHFLLFLIVPSCTDDGCDASANRTDKPERLKPLRDGREGIFVCQLEGCRRRRMRRRGGSRRRSRRAKSNRRPRPLRGARGDREEEKRREEKYVKVATLEGPPCRVTAGCRVPL